MRVTEVKEWNQESAERREIFVSLRYLLLKPPPGGASLSLNGLVLNGPNGRALRVLSIWIKEDATGETKFATLLPDKA